MAWQWLFSRRKRETCTAWGYTFEVTKQHLTQDDTAGMKMEFDRLGEMALNRLNLLCPPQASLRGPVEASNDSVAHGVRQSSSPQTPRRDLYILLRDYASQDEVLGQLWAESNTVPSWVCWDQIERGQDVFYRYGGPALTGLAFQSLLGGMVKRLSHFPSSPLR
ncbi:MAG: hypothetical protein Q9169_000270 [Polycauliona sp. 2 TL-2023]